jgi:hypothetical protein
MKKQKHPFLHFMASCLEMGYNTQNQCQPSFSAKDHCVHKFRRISEVKLELSHGNYSIYRPISEVKLELSHGNYSIYRPIREVKLELSNGNYSIYRPTTTMQDDNIAIT